MMQRRHHPGRSAGRLSRRREGLVHAVAGVLWASGVAWLIVHYFARVHGEFGDAPNPLEAWWLRLHGAAAFAALALLGLLWPIHFVPAWRARRRASGIALAALCATLVASGWLLYYAGDEDLRAIVSLAHWAVGLALVLPFLWHVLRGRTRRTPMA